jgi:hypothetical protein
MGVRARTRTKELKGEKEMKTLTKTNAVLLVALLLMTIGASVTQLRATPVHSFECSVCTTDTDCNSVPGCPVNCVILNTNLECMDFPGNYCTCTYIQ